jgi:hypothetical protein
MATIPQQTWANGVLQSTGTAPRADTDLNADAIRNNVQTGLLQMEAWIAANPAGAVLTAGQTLVLAKILVGIAKLLLADTATTTGT